MWNMLETTKICPPESDRNAFCSNGGGKKKLEGGYHSSLDGAQIDTALFPS